VLGRRERGIGYKSLERDTGCKGQICTKAKKQKGELGCGESGKGSQRGDSAEKIIFSIHSALSGCTPYYSLWNNY
jgi:hypothetical protein